MPALAERSGRPFAFETNEGPMRTVLAAPRWIVVVCLGFAPILASCASGPPVASTPTIVDVIDGDTIVVAFGPEAVETVRLLGVDTPETVDPSRPQQCFGAEASGYLRSLLPAGTHIRLERDVEARDHFGRLLGYVFRSSDQLFVNQELLRNGYADVSIYEPNSTYAPTLEAAVTSARTRNVGLWDVCGGADVALDPPPIRTG